MKHFLLTLRSVGRSLAWAALVACLASTARAQGIQLLHEKSDPYGCPRPASGEAHVPVGTSFFIEVGFTEQKTTDRLLPDSLTVRIGPRDGVQFDLLMPGGRFADGYAGRILPGRKGKPSLIIQIDGHGEAPNLLPATCYVVSVGARSANGQVLDTKTGSWQFTTEAAAATHDVQFELNTASPTVRWHGGFFTGFCKPSFCTSASNRIPSYELMDEVRKWSPKAWSLQRDIGPTGVELEPQFLAWNMPNVVRERETRRITAIEPRDDGLLLRVEDFFGHQQYGIASGRPLKDDYRPGNKVLIADNVSHATPSVLAVVEDSDDAQSLLVTPFEMPDGGWKIEYARPVPEEENPDAPGLFPPGGCYLTKFDPVGTPHYYWGRLDKEWDIAHRFRRRLVVNFTDAPGDLAVDGREWTYPKDYAEHHEVVHAFTTHLIERYDDACLDFVWSVFNEPDLAKVFWRSADWTELQKYYDYTADAILRAFEDRGYDSDRVIIGGLEIGAIFGTRLEQPILKRFLVHCSPNVTGADALVQNAAFTDERLDGKRSRRVETLCTANQGQGSPCDFISVHTYNASELAVAKLTRAKEIALETDAEYYAALWVNSFESCPDWAPPPDIAAADSYLGNGYFPTWCADVSRRLLAKAAEDNRFGFGETILTLWPWPNANFGGQNACTRTIKIDNDGDGRIDRTEAVAEPILHFLGLVAGMGEDFWVLPEQTFGGHVVSGFAAKRDEVTRVLVYSHHGLDTQSRSAASFDITLDIQGLPGRDVRVTQYRFDKDHNSYFHLGRELRDRGTSELNKLSQSSDDEMQTLVAALGGTDREAQLAAINKLALFGESGRRVPQVVAEAVFALHQTTESNEVKSAIEVVAQKVFAQEAGYTEEEVAQIRELSQLHVTNESTHAVAENGEVQLSIPVAANGANFLVIEPRDRL